MPPSDATIPARGHGGHRCDLGGSEWGYRQVGVGGLSRCECGRWWVLRNDYRQNTLSRHRWRPVRWWNLLLRNRIARHEDDR